MVENFNRGYHGGTVVILTGTICTFNASGSWSIRDYGTTTEFEPGPSIEAVKAEFESWQKAYAARQKEELQRKREVSRGGINLNPGNAPKLTRCSVRRDLRVWMPVRVALPRCNC